MVCGGRSGGFGSWSRWRLRGGFGRAVLFADYWGRGGVELALMGGFGGGTAHCGGGGGGGLVVVGGGGKFL